MTSEPFSPKKQIILTMVRSGKHFDFGETKISFSYQSNDKKSRFNLLVT